MTELTRRCLSLNRQSREHLIKALQESLNEKEYCNEERFRTLYNVATEIFGQGILTRSRDFLLVLARRCIVHQMREEGYSYPAIGKHLIRHHASIIHMQKMMEDVFSYPQVFSLEMTYWNMFQKKLKEYETHERANQDS